MVSDKHISLLLITSGGPDPACLPCPSLTQKKKVQEKASYINPSGVEKPIVDPGWVYGRVVWVVWLLPGSRL